LEGREVKPLVFDNSQHQHGSKKRVYLERLNRSVPFKYNDVFNSENFRIYTPLNLRKLLDVQELILKNNIKTFNELQLREDLNKRLHGNSNNTNSYNGCEEPTPTHIATSIEGKRLAGNKLSMSITVPIGDGKKSSHQGNKDFSKDGNGEMSIQGVAMQVPDVTGDSQHPHSRASSMVHSNDAHHHRHFSKKHMKSLLHHARTNIGEVDSHDEGARGSILNGRISGLSGQGFPQILMSLPGQISSHNNHGRRTMNSHDQQSLQNPNSTVSSRGSDIDPLVMTDSISLGPLPPFTIAEEDNREDEASMNNSIQDSLATAMEQSKHLMPILGTVAMTQNSTLPSEVNHQDLLADSPVHAELRQFEFTLDKDIQKMIKHMRAERKRQMKALQMKQNRSIAQSALYNLAKMRGIISDKEQRKGRDPAHPNRNRSSSGSPTRSPSPDPLVSRTGLQSRGSSDSRPGTVHRNLDIEYEEWQIKILQWLGNTAQDNAKYEIDTRGEVNHVFDDRPVEIGVGLHHHGSIFNAIDFEKEKKPVEQWKDINVFTDEPLVAFRDIDQIFKREVGVLGEYDQQQRLFSEELADEFFVKRFGPKMNGLPTRPREHRQTFILKNTSGDKGSHGLLTSHHHVAADASGNINEKIIGAGTGSDTSTVDNATTASKADDFTLSSMGNYEQLKHKKRVRITEIHNKNYDQQHKRHQLRTNLETFGDDDEEHEDDPDDMLNFSPTLASSNASRGESRNSVRINASAADYGASSAAAIGSLSNTASRPGSVTSGILNEATLASMLSHRYQVNSNPFADIPSSTNGQGAFSHRPPSEPKSSASFASPRKTKIIK
jgi:hypothetical protein